MIKILCWISDISVTNHDQEPRTEIGRCSVFIYDRKWYHVKTMWNNEQYAQQVKEKKKKTKVENEIKIFINNNKFKLLNIRWDNFYPSFGF